MTFQQNRQRQINIIMKEAKYTKMKESKMLKQKATVHLSTNHKIIRNQGVCLDLYILILIVTSFM